MIHASAIAESIVAPTLFRPEFLHSLDPQQKSRGTSATTFLGGFHAENGALIRYSGMFGAAGLNARTQNPEGFRTAEWPLATSSARVSISRCAAEPGAKFPTHWPVSKALAKAVRMWIGGETFSPNTS